MSAAAPRVVVVTRPSEYEELLYRHGTKEQARFFLEGRGRRLEPLAAAHERLAAAVQQVSAAIPLKWRRTRLQRRDLDRFLFGPEDLVVAVGQDGLVANTAKYLDGQPVLGINPDPRACEGVLARHPPAAAADLLPALAAGRAPHEERTMVEAALDDGQKLLALNEIFLGHASHQSARYRLAWQGREERQSSSGLIVATGTGATGWARSIQRERRKPPPLPRPEEPRLVFFVREAWPSVNTGVGITAGLLAAGEELLVVSEMNENGVIFGDGLEGDRLEYHWGLRAALRLARRRLRLA